MMPDNFVNIELAKNNLDRYVIRTAILKAIRSTLGKFKGELLDLGCGKMPYRKLVLEESAVEKYVGLDIENALEYDSEVQPDFTWDGITMPFANNKFETVFATEVLEHCPEPKIILGEVNRVLKSGGVFFFTVPFLWPLHEVPHDEFRYTPFSLQRLLAENEFENIEINATGGWHAAMAQMLGLWVARSPMGRLKRKVLASMLKPIIGYLSKVDQYATVDFNESQMITGLYGVAYKK